MFLNLSTFGSASSASQLQCRFTWLPHSSALPLYALLLALVMLFSGSEGALAVDPPTITPAAGTYIVNKTISMVTGQGAIYYTTNGTQPTNLSNAYSGSFSISRPTLIKAVAYVSGTGTYSSVATSYFNVNSDAGPPTANLVLHLAASSGLTLGTGNPQPVQAWADQSSANNNATAVSGSEPTLSKSSAIESSVAFNGAQYFALPTGFADFSLGATIFAVIRPNALYESQIVDLGQGSAGNNLSLSINADGKAKLATFNGTSETSAQAQNSLVIGKPQLIEAIFNGGSTPSTAQVFVDSKPGTANTNMNGLANVSRTFNFIAKKSDDTGNKFPGKILELIIYNRKLSDVERFTTRLFLTRRHLLAATEANAPEFSIPSSTLAGPTMVAIEPPPNCGITRYTCDGSLPTLASPEYKAPILVNHSQTISAFSIVNGVPSPTSTVTYTLDPVLWPAPSTSDSSSPDFELELPTNATQP